MVDPVERYDPEGIDYGWVMQVTFLLTIVIGVPVIAILSTVVELNSWSDRAQFAVAFGAVLWFLIGISVYGYESKVRN